MEKDKEKAMYESPVTKETQVTLESDICASSCNVVNANNDNGRIEGHDVNTEFGGSWGDNQGWDD